jgi:Icc-related predicted phosphoesterase
VRIFFTSDVHSSERCFKKICSSVKYDVYKADVIFVNGDLTGKALIPIVETDGTYVAQSEKVLGSNLTSTSFDEVYSTLRNAGCYPIRMTENEVNDLLQSKEKVSALFKKLMLETIADWLRRLDDLSQKTGRRFLMMPGNDDVPEIGSLIANSRIENPEDKILKIDACPMVSTGYSNSTPWRTPRECSEEQLESRISSAIDGLTEFDNAIFNLHCPPYDSGLDTAPMLDENLTPKVTMGDLVRIPVGSTAVRNMIEKCRPLLSMHGHIHESPGDVRIGRTTCINPGSEYQSGILRAYIVDIADGKIKQCLRVEN